jgi:hypothetical protein
MNHSMEKVERKEAPGGTLKDLRIWRPPGRDASTELAVDTPAPMLLASLGCGDCCLDPQRELTVGRRRGVGRRAAL